MTDLEVLVPPAGHVAPPGAPPSVPIHDVGARLLTAAARQVLEVGRDAHGRLMPLSGPTSARVGAESLAQTWARRNVLRFPALFGSNASNFSLAGTTGAAVPATLGRASPPGTFLHFGCQPPAVLPAAGPGGAPAAGPGAAAALPPAPPAPVVVPAHAGGAAALGARPPSPPSCSRTRGNFAPRTQFLGLRAGPGGTGGRRPGSSSGSASGASSSSGCGPSSTSSRRPGGSAGPSAGGAGSSGGHRSDSSPGSSASGGGSPSSASRRASPRRCASRRGCRPAPAQQSQHQRRRRRRRAHSAKSGLGRCSGRAGRRRSGHAVGVREDLEEQDGEREVRLSAGSGRLAAGEPAPEGGCGPPGRRLRSRGQLPSRGVNSAPRSAGGRNCGRAQALASDAARTPRFSN